MSLINNMLAGLEDRQAYMSEGRDLVLDGLTSVNDDNFHNSGRRSTVFLKVILLLSLALFFSTLVYKNYFGHPAFRVPSTARTEAITPPVALPLQTVTAVKQESRPVAATPSQPEVPPPAVNQVALKMDYSITRADQPVMTTGAATDTATKKTGDITPTVTRNTEDETSAVAKKTESETPAATVKTEDETPAATAVAPAITAYSIRSDATGGMAVKLTLSSKAKYRIYGLKNPYRVAVEIERFLSLPNGIPKRYGHGLIMKIRGHHIYHNKRTLVVFDLSGKGIVKHSGLQQTDNGYELSMDITPARPVHATGEKNSIISASSSDTHARQQVAEAKAGTLSVKKTNSSPDQMLDQGLNDYQKGDIQEGLEEIAQVLELEPTHVRARSTLVNLLIEQNRLPQAIEVLDSGIRLRPTQYDWVELKAKLLVRLNKYADAIQTLSSSGPNINDNPEYYAFLAALLQQQGRNDEAVQYYQKVVNARGDNGVWWMGLGISLERTGKPKQAEKAYRNAIQDGSLSPDIRDYINKRLSILSQQ